ncbi:MAG: hypothetical protein QXG86_03550 [Candidatus Woesearchaeota archaeon]
MDKEQFFYKPHRVDEIIGSRAVKFASKDIAEKIIELSDEEALIIPNLVPNDYSGRINFLKRAPQVILYTGKNSAEAIKNKITPLKARKKAFNALRSDKKYCGYCWKSLRKNEHKRVTLVECIEGAKLFAYTEISGAQIEIAPYNDAVDVGYFGGKFKVKVSSRTPKHPRYEITLENVPVKKSRINPVIWTDITATHSCKILINDFSYRYVSSEDFCAHIIAAYIKLAKSLFYEEKNIVPLEFTPFALPSKITTSFYNKMQNQVMVEYSILGKKRRRPINKAEKEILLWELVKILGHDSTFYAKEKLTDYKW